MRSDGVNSSHITTHILDTTRGRPAVGIAVRLEARGPAGWNEIGSGLTNDDGRIGNLGPARLKVGTYRIAVDIGAYYRTSQIETFFTTVWLAFSLQEPAQHYHVPLLISPFAVSTYRGS
jgi:5-hydroxyisourate hydrolase